MTAKLMFDAALAQMRNGRCAGLFWLCIAYKHTVSLTLSKLGGSDAALSRSNNGNSHTRS
jgi:hypothetical protein